MEGANQNINMTPEAPNNETTVIQTDIGNKDGQEKCPKCGSTDIELNVQTGKLRCNFCRHEFEPQKVTGMVEDVSSLSGQVISSGMSDIVADTNDVVTFKCSSCGAEVVIDTASALQARCHWCRNTLSVQQQIPNGSVPDEVLPFKVTKEEARTLIAAFVNKRKFFANPKFKKEFTTENIMGVYFPYMIVDVNSHANFKGQGEHLVRRYTVGSGDSQRTYYDADLYNVEREFDIAIDDLTIESNTDRLNSTAKDKTNNIINSIMPFDTENCVKYDANYLKGYTSERRDINLGEIEGLVQTQAKDVARFAANESLKEYDRGIAWQYQGFDVKGSQWKAAYLPVWLYSYQEVKGNKKLLHYVAVNARTKETMGSVPIHMPVLIAISVAIEILGIFIAANVDSDYSWIFLLPGIVFFALMYMRYRNTDARHTYETETKKTVSNLRKVDTFVEHRKGLSNSRMAGANNTSVNGTSVKSGILGEILEQNGITKEMRDTLKKK